MPKPDAKTGAIPSQLANNITVDAQRMRLVTFPTQLMHAASDQARALCQARSRFSWSSAWAIEIRSSARSLRVFP